MSSFYNPLQVTIDTDKCCICQTLLSEKNYYPLPECGHIFHTECIISWFRHSKQNCPLCMNIGTVLNSEFFDYGWGPYKSLCNIKRTYLKSCNFFYNYLQKHHPNSHFNSYFKKIISLKKIYSEKKIQLKLIEKDINLSFQELSQKYNCQNIKQFKKIINSKKCETYLALKKLKACLSICMTLPIIPIIIPKCKNISIQSSSLHNLNSENITDDVASISMSDD